MVWSTYENHENWYPTNKSIFTKSKYDVLIKTIKRLIEKVLIGVVIMEHVIIWDNVEYDDSSNQCILFN